jgi:hypothetical protein
MDPIVFAVLLFVAQPSESSFNSYDVFLSPRTLPGACASASAEELRNRTYTFRSPPFDSPVTLSGGKLIERNILGTPEWEISLVSAEAINVAGRRAVLAVVGFEHVNGTGGASHVFVAECRKQRLFVLFEAGGEGVREATFLPERGLTVIRWLWSPTDGHCCPSKEVEERYRWDRATNRFVRVSRVERNAGDQR